MRTILTFVTIMTTLSTTAQQTGASTVKTTFSRETSVSISIQADPSIIWALLTNASDFPRWNSTIIALEGDIAEGEKIRLTSTLDSNRTFKLKVKELQHEKRMVWGDGKGERVYTLEEKTPGMVTFTMREKIGGLMFPLYAKYIPSFNKSFEQFASDLKKEAEIIQSAKN